MEIEPVEGTVLRLPPGRVAVRLTPAQARAYRALYARYGTLLAGLPVLRAGDLAGRRLILHRDEVDALNEAFSKLEETPRPAIGDPPFAAQERSKNRLAKQLQYLS